MVITLSLLTFVFVFVLILVFMGRNNQKLATKAEYLQSKKEALVILRHAIDHMSQYGIGENLEFANARGILELAMINVLEGR